MASKMSVQKKNRSRDLPSDASQADVPSGKNAPTLAAKGVSRSTVPGGFRFKTNMSSGLLINPLFLLCRRQICRSRTLFDLLAHELAPVDPLIDGHAGEDAQYRDQNYGSEPAWLTNDVLK